MMIAMLVITEKICGWLTLMSRMAIATRPMMTAGSTGVWKRGLTLASREAAGRLLSRAIANASRMPAVCTASSHTVIAMTTHQSTICPMVEPSVESTTYCRPSTAVPWVQIGHGEQGEEEDQTADEEGRDQGPQDGAGALRPGSLDSSPSDEAVSKPYMTYAEASDAVRNAPK